MKRRKILVPLDGSEFSRQVLPHIRRLFPPEAHELVLLRVVQQWEGVLGDALWMATAGVEMPVYVPQWGHGYAGTDDAKDWQEIMTVLEDEMEEELVPLQSAGYAVSVAVHAGDPASEIAAYAEEAEVDLVAMATHGRTGLSRMVMGSVAGSLLPRLAVPLLLVHPMPPTDEVRLLGEIIAAHTGGGGALRIAVAVDSSPTCHPAAEVAGDLARSLGARLTPLVAIHESEGLETAQAAMAQVSRCVGDGVDTVPCEPLVGLADEVLLRHLRDHEYDLVITGPLRHAGETDMYTIGAAAHRIAQYAPTALFMAKGARPAFRTILVAANVGDEPVVEAATRFASAVGASLRFLHVVPPDAVAYVASEASGPLPLDAILAQPTPLAAFLRHSLAMLHEAGFTRDLIRLREGNVAETILHEARATGCDLIVVGDQSGPGRFLGSVSDRVLRHAHRSVLVIRTV